MQENEIEAIDQDKQRLHAKINSQKEKIDKLYSIILTESLLIIALLLSIGLMEWCY